MPSTFAFGCKDNIFFILYKMYYTNCIIQIALYKLFNILRIFYCKSVIIPIKSAIKYSE